MLDVPGWPGHLAGQHVDVRLTAAGRLQRAAQLLDRRAARGDRIELTVQRVPDGEVSPYLVEVPAGDPVEVRGPVGGWFVWRPTDTAPVLLVAGGSGIVPLMAMVRARRAAGSRVPFRLIYSVRTPDDVYYADELRPGATADWTWLRLHAREARMAATPGRISVADVNADGLGPDAGALLRVRADRLRGDGGRHPRGPGPRAAPGQDRAIRTDGRMSVTDRANMDGNALAGPLPRGSRSM